MLQSRCLLAILFGCLITSASAQQADFYVAPDGDDAGSGTVDQPFATVHRVQKAVWELLKTDPDRDVQVLIRGGRYELPAPLIFSPDDSSATHRVVYAAYPGESPVLSGGRAITGWTKGEADRWRARVPEDVPAFRDLYADGKRLTRARFPNAGEVAHVEAVSEDVTEITLDAPLPVDNLEGQGAELVVLQNWSCSRVAVRRLEGALVVSTVPVGWIGHGDYTTASPGKPAHVEHALAFLDQPGEWYLDIQSRTLHYQAAPGEDPNTRRFVAPVLDHLLVVRGTREAPVRNVAFRGVAFEHAAWTLPDFGYLGIQAGHYGTRTDAPTHVLPAAIQFEFAQGCRIEQCRLAHTGASGIAFGAGCRNNAVVGCTITDIGGNGIMVGRRDGAAKEDLREDSFLAADWKDPADAPASNEIGHNEIYRVGAVHFGAVGIFDAFSNGTHIHHNHVWDLPYTGISVGFRWNTTPTSQRAARIEHNHIHDVMKLLADGGGIYTLGFQPGTLLRGNIIHDVYRSALAHGGAPNNGIFFDEGTKGLHVEDTVIYNTSGEPIRFNQTNADNLTWGANYFGVSPGEENFPKHLVGEVGLVDLSG